MVGPGKYDEEVTEMQKRLDAHGVLLIVVKGNRGNGFSIAATEGVLNALPELLEETARQIRLDRDSMFKPQN